MLTAPMQGTGVNISEQRLIAQPRAHLADSLKRAPDCSTKSSNGTSHGLAGRAAPLLSDTAPQQSSRAEDPWQALHTPAPHPGLQRTARASPAVWQEQGLLTASGGLLSRAPTPCKQCLQQHTAWATLGHTAATALAQFSPHSRQGGRQHGSLSVCAHLTPRGPSI